MGTNSESLALLKAYEGMENNHHTAGCFWEVLQVLGQVKNSVTRQAYGASEEIRLNLGCGTNIIPNFVNIDSHSTRSLLSLDKSVFRWDLRKGLPFEDSAVAGIFTEHFLEHLNPSQGYYLLCEMYRVLSVGSTLRISVPDLKKYFDYAAFKYGITDECDIEIRESFGKNWLLASEALRALSCYLGHYSIYDSQLLKTYLLEVGFRDVKVCSYGQGRDESLLQDHPDRVWNSLYIEGVR